MFYEESKEANSSEALAWKAPSLPKICRNTLKSVWIQISHVVLSHLIPGWATFMGIKAPFEEPKISESTPHPVIIFVHLCCLQLVLTPTHTGQLLHSCFSSTSPRQMENHGLIHPWWFTTFLMLIICMGFGSITCKTSAGPARGNLSIKSVCYLHQSSRRAPKALHKHRLLLYFAHNRRNLHQ